MLCSILIPLNICIMQTCVANGLLPSQPTLNLRRLWATKMKQSHSKSAIWLSTGQIVHVMRDNEIWPSILHDHASHSSFLCKCFVQEACAIKHTPSCDAFTACATISFHLVFLLLFLPLLQPLLSLLGAFVLFLPLFLLGWLPRSQQLTQSSCRPPRIPPSISTKRSQCQVAISRSFLTLRPMQQQLRTPRQPQR